MVPSQRTSLPREPSTHIPLDRLFARPPTDVSAWNNACTQLAAAHTEVTCSVETQPTLMLLIGFDDESALARQVETAVMQLALPFCRMPEVAAAGWVVLAVATPPLASVYDCSSGEHSGFFRRRAVK